MQRRGWLCVSPLTSLLCDVTVTLLGQEDCYWQGDYDSAIEGNPFAHPILAYHPFLFIAGAMVYAAILIAVLYFWHHRLGIVMSFLFTLSHSIGSATWLTRHGVLGWIAAIVLIFLLERWFTFCLRRARVERVEEF